MEFIFKAIGITILVVIVALYYLEFFKAVRERKIINSRINNNVLQTKDIKIWSKTVFNFDDKFDYCKFYFFEDEVYIKFKNTSPKVYSIPFVLKKNLKRKYSYFNVYNIVRFESKDSKINIHFKNKFLFGSEFILNLENINNSDFDLLNKNFQNENQD